MRIQVVELPRTSRILFEGSLPGCVQYCHGVAHEGMTRLAMVVEAPRPDAGPDVMACVPLRGFDSWLTMALELVVTWDDEWLLLDSMPRPYREEARDGLAKLVADALLAAAMGGVDAGGGTGDLPF